MKKTMSSLARMSLSLSAMVVGLGSFQVFASTPVEKRVPITHVYAPKGFDSNDRAEVFVTGYLPNLCHRSPVSKVEVKGHTINVEMTSLYYESQNPFCPQMKVPFEQSVKVGVLEKGIYEIVVNGGLLAEEKSTIIVNESTSDAIDDFVYSAVNAINKDEANGVAELKGYNPSDCYILDKVRTFSNNVDTYSILPVMKQIYSFCPMKMVPFNIEYKVPTEIQRDEVLLHVRTMDGNSVNSVFKLQPTVD